ncbi:hypothetical protein PTSG_12342 [Salpingoeca rosetta]|uniref:Annexin n=1 Tax=Salpingoeca rosetta (strain ATCC 50818 / BSB-021) TaxID=946362 RepID=F2UBR9_SALR5|nr:uncharacterized protein PTSG_12342 [Salpingoeca rosetta]EGD73935.1 hypothetical protein PTSG_12342 [Salpingoeca rosetta]|eukprot:XP_004993498.1 hypothetical protein PTSG_12342 [Salpingoeca rosetta]
MATVTPREDFDAEALAADLRKAMKGFGTDEDTIIEILTSVDNAQRQELRAAFKTMYGRDLVKDLKSELGGKLEDAVRAMLRPPAELDAWELRQAMKGAGTDEETIAEILASRTNEEIAAIREAYKEKFDGDDLEEDIMSETGGHLRRIFVSLVQGNRDESEEVDEDKAQADVRLCLACCHVFASPVCEAYRGISDYDLSKAVKKEMSGDLEFAFLAVLECARNPPKFFAKRLHRAIKGAGTDDDALIRIIVSRSEKDLADIAEAYIDEYEKSLVAAVKDDCSGDYEKLLVALLK